ncbi:MAG: pyruvate, phosphate dikinase [Omnitrophica bacterium RIFCSPLOWO2_12_FULL_44_17]|uniref:Pyruvate, phosphate dikinase n=1 Tax=Candidatus Danuiimicrobium aquiferis TaxID=1801832 RepID=A0A1G1L1E6_9BACT|nr:MAG: pyruvate, phosphate dikinase [Omnitrophica bacterium RIFCSPHIGHO2_02_FULL_45_28]OGW88188.1 MAG: pyruvate, phosphate dikinase [Omnitrophica bacterium RIFCSPHIGHO2_12_FULL_44_12]OGW98948.1 MAG: pyruvate, phosphate dikinase [Omnitrophica bacterium RIFCSPLOWO2_12_FULL_44_17]OGX02039.1 MAG: pyruvate, phosphate dikinase [Omnitrophica bacterium RIFCSPLOWO2_02_FULL_44_11]
MTKSKLGSKKSKSVSKRWVYFFGNGKAEGNAKMKQLLGGKGANLAEMTNLGIPVPAGFTITTEACAEFYNRGKKWPVGLDAQVEANLKKLETTMGLKFGSRDNPLLVSVRSGAAASMPGMMDTVLNLGLNSDVVQGLIIKTENERFAWDAYRRFIQMFGDVVMEVPREHFEHVLDKKKQQLGVKNDVDLNANDLKDVVRQYKKIYQDHTSEEFPSDPMVQLSKTIDAVFNSWNNPRANKYRELNDIRGLLGTAVNVQTMVFGNMGDTSGTGVCFSRNPSTGVNHFYGEFLMNAQGEDVVAGIRTPQPLDELKKVMPEIYQQLCKIREKLENHYCDMQDMEFTIQQGKLYLLQTRNGKRTAHAAVKIAVDMVKEKMISKDKAILRIAPNDLNQLLHPTFDPKEKKQAIAKGLPASPGAATGKVVFNADDAESWAKNGEKVILVRIETSPEDIGGMHAAQGILTARGGMTSHAAVVARGMGKCCVAGCEGVHIDYNKKEFTAGNTMVREGDYISLNGSTGEVYLGQVKTIDAQFSGDFSILMKWADSVRKLNIRTNADTPLDSQIARKFGAEGIGLCRTEHMFFEGDRIVAMREMILADNKEQREKALAKLLPIQRDDFEKIFTAMNGLPVTIRLLDPPLHEFVPHEAANQEEMAKAMNVPVELIRRKVASLHEFNPMLGHRGCRLGVTYPEMYNMQSRAIIEAACNMKRKGIKVYPEIMIPLVGTLKEFSLLKSQMLQVIEKVFQEKKTKVDYKIGTMIEIPRAALVAGRIAEEAEFFSFGTNDLTQMTFGYSRDDAGVFLKDYIEQGILEKDPFTTVDQEGVGALIRMGITEGRKTRKDLKVGICGEHGGDPASVEFCHSVGMNYVSCSPFRVPIARLAAAQAVLKRKA